MCVEAVAATETRNAHARSQHATEVRAHAAAAAAHARALGAWERECRRLSDAHARTTAAARRAHDCASRTAAAAAKARGVVLQTEHAHELAKAQARHEAAAEAVRRDNAAKREQHRALLAVRTPRRAKRRCAHAAAPARWLLECVESVHRS